MERLTEKFVCNLPDEVLEKLGIADIPKEDYEIKGTNGELCRETCEKYECDSCPIQKAIEKLAEYEDLEEQGLMLRLPCKVGTQVWKIKECSGGGRIPNWHEIYNVNFALELLSDFGETVFLTKEEAEQALAEMNGV